MVTSIGNDEMGASALRRRFNVRISASMAFRWCSREFVWVGSMNSGVIFTPVLPTGNERERREERTGLLSRRQFPRPFMGLVGCGRSNGECPYTHSAVINLWFSTPHLQLVASTTFGPDCICRKSRCPCVCGKFKSCGSHSIISNARQTTCNRYSL